MPTACLKNAGSIELRVAQTIGNRLENRANAVGALVRQALLKEVELTPKPGLVDRNNSGSHVDMDLASFHASIAALSPWFPIFYRIGESCRDLAPEMLLGHLRSAGLTCENAMFRATGGVNTHKGSIFSMGLLSAAVGRLGGDELPDRNRLCEEVIRMCSHLVEDELLRLQTARTAGEKLFLAYGLTGVRGEAATGFQTVRSHGLPAFGRILTLGGGEEEALHEALLHLLAANHDTNLVHRGGLAGLAHVQARAKGLIEAGGVRCHQFQAEMLNFDSDLIAQNLSPGGSADLLAITWFLSQFPEPRSN
jgi:triphosphoribosyl-dephospho-CoA synthase